jgi:hypothetical protein
MPPINLELEKMALQQIRIKVTTRWADINERNLEIVGNKIYLVHCGLFIKLNIIKRYININ